MLCAQPQAAAVLLGAMLQNMPLLGGSDSASVCSGKTSLRGAFLLLGHVGGVLKAGHITQ